MKPYFQKPNSNISNIAVAVDLPADIHAVLNSSTDEYWGLSEEILFRLALSVAQEKKEASTIMHRLLRKNLGNKSCR